MKVDDDVIITESKKLRTMLFIYFIAAMLLFTPSPTSIADAVRIVSLAALVLIINLIVEGAT